MEALSQTIPRHNSQLTAKGQSWFAGVLKSNGSEGIPVAKNDHRMEIEIDFQHEIDISIEISDGKVMVRDD
jgi:hypothetical protein